MPAPASRMPFAMGRHGPLLSLVVLVAANEALAATGWPRIHGSYLDAGIGFAIVAIAASSGRTLALAASAWACLYLAFAQFHLGWPPRLTEPAALGLSVLLFSYFGVVLVVDAMTRRLRSQQLQLEEAQALARVGSYEWDVVKDRLVASREVNRLGGLPADRPFSRATLLAHVHPEDRPRLDAAVRTAMHDGRPFLVVLRIRRADGEERELEARGQAERGPDGRARRVVGTLQDVTERVQAERAALASHERLVALDRMKDDFVTSVSHELRTPLTAVKGYLEFLADELGGPLAPPQAEYVANARAGAARLERLVDDLLDFALLEAGEFRLQTAPTRLPVVARRVIGMLGAQAASVGVALALEGEPPDVVTDADEARVEQVLLNLVGNAIKFTPAGGRVAVRILATGADLRVEVADDGPGVPPEAQPQLFDKFYRLRRAGDVQTGTGLGLAIAKRLIEAHGGRIGVESAPGVGSTFWFTLPRSAAPAYLPLGGGGGGGGAGGS